METCGLSPTRSARRTYASRISKMHFMRTFAGLMLAVLASANVTPARAEEEIHVGRSAAGQLKVHLEFTPPVGIPPSVFPGIPGYATADLALHSTVLDEPDEDLFQLSTAVDLRFVLLAKDPGMEVWNDHGSAFMATNESFGIGQSPFDLHPVWNLVNGIPGNEYALTLKLHDQNGIYSDSDPFVLPFTPQPLPGPFSLHIAQSDATHVTLSWPTQALGWELQSAPTANAANWELVTNAPVVVGTNFSLSISTGTEPQFFRLHRP